MASEIQGYINELKQLDLEVKNLRISLKKLNDRKKVIEGEIIKYLEAKDQPGVKYKGVAVVAQEKKTRERKKKGEKLEDGKNILREYGVRDSDEVLERLLEAMKGDVKNVKSVKLFEETKLKD
jgi:hypothetical protein